MRLSDGHLIRIPRGPRMRQYKDGGKRHPTLQLIPRLFLLDDLPADLTRVSDRNSVDAQISIHG